MTQTLRKARGYTEFLKEKKSLHMIFIFLFLKYFWQIQLWWVQKFNFTSASSYAMTTMSCPPSSNFKIILRARLGVEGGVRERESARLYTRMQIPWVFLFKIKYYRWRNKMPHLFQSTFGSLMMENNPSS